jgi:lipoate-protein ligase B
VDLDFPLRHRLIVGQDGHRVVLMGIQLDHGAAAHSQELVHGNDGAAQDHGDFDFDGIVPCGIRQHGVTSLADLGVPATMADVDVAMKRCFEKIFG